ncbi:MAG: hypothetical protein EHM27_01370 [Deltaproteobacteria bacterium]|nr:MAG: hypothetical protein EHM27_01370 [Deltaproteobacteria bacterium]
MNSTALRRIQTALCPTTIAFLVLLAAGVAQSAENSAEKGTDGTEKRHHFLIELKREATNRGTRDETSKTQLKFDVRMDGIVSLLRLEVPLPDEKTSFEGDPFNPRLGDIKVRVGFHPVRLENIPFMPFFEVTFPTATREELGKGKYQISPGVRGYVPISFSHKLPESHRVSFEPQIQQVVSVAGDENRKNINYTKFELTLGDTWRKKYFFKLIAKPIVAWEQNGNTGAVGEMEGGLIIHGRWRVWLLLGSRLWGSDTIPSTYDKRVGLNASLTF